MNKTERAAVVNDPDGHFPYKGTAAIKAGVPEEVAALCERVVRAQQAYLEDPNDKTFEARNAAEREAQEQSAALKHVRRQANLRRLIADADAGNQGAHVDFVGPPSGQAASPGQSRDFLQAQLDEYEGGAR